MKIQVKKQIGKNELIFSTDEPDFDKAMSEILPFSQPDYCGLCKNDKVIFEVQKGSSDKGTFTYVKRKCLKCNATSTLGKFKDGGYFWKEWNIYNPDQPKQQAPQPETKPQPQPQEEAIPVENSEPEKINVEDIPF